MDEPEKGEPVTPCMDVYKARIQSDGIIYKLRLIILVRGDIQNRDLIRDTWSPTAFVRTLKYSVENYVKHKAILHQLYFIGTFLQPKVKNRVFVKLDSRYAEYFP